MKTKWEVIEKDLVTLRLRVPGGWLYCVGGIDARPTFVPDPLGATLNERIELSIFHNQDRRKGDQ